MLFKGATVYTMDNEKIINSGVIRIENGKFTFVGCDAEPFSGEEVVDVTGKFIFPGFIDGHTHIGLIGDSEKFESEDINEITDPTTPHLRAIDAINPLDRCFSEAVAGGITTVCTGPGSANPVGGQTAIIETVGKRVENITVCEPGSMKFAFGENPKMCYHGKGQTPETRMGTAAIIREILTKANNYNKKKTQYEQNITKEEPAFDMKLEALRPVVRGEVAAHFHAHKANDIFTAIRIAKEFGLDYTLVHCTEGHLVADELAKEGVNAFVGPNLSDRSKPELRNLEFSNPARLYEAGILFGITTDHPVIPVQYLPICAALAQKSGLPYMEALKAITCNPAKILKIDDRKGSIRIGLDADMIICDGDPLAISTKYEAVYIRGNKVV